MRWPILLFVVCLVYAFWALGVGWNHTLMDVHGHRQAQTAITVEYLLKDSSWIRYETPILGAPWSIPFEFPLYQWIVAGLVAILGTPLVQTGRLVAATFFLLTLLPVLSLQQTLGVRDDRRFILPSLLLVSPLYLFWSRAFLIESTALFLSVSFVALGCDWIVSPSPSTRKGLLVAGTGCLAAVVKFTTLLGFLPILAGVWLWENARKPSSLPRLALAALILAGLPILAGLGWTSFCDATKRENVLAAGVLTSDVLRDWTFGTLTQKLDGASWALFLRGTVTQGIGSPWPLLLTLVLALLIPTAYRRGMLGLFGAFFFVPALFTNLHFVHVYYPYANVIFLIAALAACITGCLVSPRSLVRLGGIALLVSCVAFGVRGYLDSFFLLQSRNWEPDRELIARVQQVADSNQVVMIYGEGSNPQLPFYLNRRALMDRDNRDIDGPTMIQARKALDDRGFRLSALLACHEARDSTRLIRRATGALGFDPSRRHAGKVCDLYARAE